MQNNSINLDALKTHLFEALEGVKNLSDPQASENEKISLGQAKAIVGLSSQIIGVYKTQLDAIKLVREETRMEDARGILIALGVTDGDNAKQIEGKKQ